MSRAIHVERELKAEPITVNRICAKCRAGPVILNVEAVEKAEKGYKI